jgi:protein-S-isoprenylcysteine O-methyltransferase Ste14
MKRRSVWAVFQVVVTTLAWIGAPFAGAGRLDWYRAWICVALYSICMPVVGAIVKRVNAPVLDARKKWLRPNTKRFDKVFLAAYLPLVYLQPVIAGLDAVRCHWSSMPFWLVYPGTLLLLLSLALVGWSLAVNRFAENSVRIQEDRGHIAITEGPYRIVRHPMYVGSMLMYIATALILGSVWALVVAGVIMTLFIWRTTLEDRMLRAELPGYAEYAGRTPYRLIPAVW